jgi:hypothetical protein
MASKVPRAQSSASIASVAPRLNYIELYSTNRSCIELCSCQRGYRCYGELWRTARAIGAMGATEPVAVLADGTFFADVWHCFDHD